MSSGRRKLLLADDSPTIQKVISLTFGDEDFEVVAVGDGTQALRALADDPPPDVVLADVVMPGPDGYELCERIKRDARLGRVPVVLLVGTFEPFNEAEARRVGADTVLTKPFQSIRNLVGKVGSLLGGEAKPDEPEDARAPREGRPAD
ncbi:MAG TPA: response regulator, partial [Pyrinomonadaceae bacterium]